MSVSDIGYCFVFGFVLSLFALYLGSAYWAMRSAASSVVE